MPVVFHQLTKGDAVIMRSLNEMFGIAFGMVSNYCDNSPSEDYLVQLLGGDSLIALVAIRDNNVIGGLAAYELKKFEQKRSEIYIYDLAVAAEERRQGIATGLIERLKVIGRERGAYEIFLQADTNSEDEPAIALYSKLGVREDVIHFAIPISGAIDVT